jgi:hypothetical protein
MKSTWKSAGLLLLALITLAVTGTSQSSNKKGPVFAKTGELMLPKGYRQWMFVGAPITPNGLNGGKAPFSRVS